MRNLLILSSALLLTLGSLGCKRGLKSEACETYFAKVETCAAQAPPMKADILRTTANASKEQFEKNSNPIAVEKSCEMMAETLTRDPDCK
jgi:hypothetical protein